MRKSNTKTSLSIILNPNGSVQTYLKWADIDAGHHKEASERIIIALSNIPDYEWLFCIIQPIMHQKYCGQCSNFDVDKPCEDDKTEPFPYCYLPKQSNG